MQSCSEQFDFFQQNIQDLLDAFLHMKEAKQYPTDKLWVQIPHPTMAESSSQWEPSSVQASSELGKPAYDSLLPITHGRPLRIWQHEMVVICELADGNEAQHKCQD